MCDISINTLVNMVLSSVMLVGLVTIFCCVTYKMNELEEDAATATRRGKELRRVLNSLEKKQSVYDAKVSTLERELELTRMDKTGKVDYAYGGRVVASGDTETFLTGGVSLFGVPICGGESLEKRILEESVLPGQCWPFRGHRGSAVIELITAVKVTEVTLEHGREEIMVNRSLTSAPREVVLTGLQDEEGNHRLHEFGTFEFKLPGPSLQTFPVPHPISTRFKTVELKIISNHGHEAFTCVYRVRIHGHP